MRRVSGNVLIGLRTTYSGPWISRILVNTFYFRTTSSEFFIFFLDFTIYMCIYISNISYIYIHVHETGFTGSFLSSRSIDAEFGVRLLEKANILLPRSHKHHPKSMGSLPPKTYRNIVTSSPARIHH